jgi:hypothetical protein
MALDNMNPGDFVDEVPAEETFTGFTAKDELASSLAPSEKGNFQYLKKIVSLATDKPEELGDVDFNATIRDAYPSVAEVNNLLDYDVGTSFAQRGIISGVEMAAKAIDNRISYLEQQQRNHIYELNELTQAAVDKIVASSPKVVLNNPPEKMAEKATTVKPSVSYSAVMEMLTKQASSVSGNVGSILWGFTPAALKEGYDVDQFAREYLGESAGVNTFTGLKYESMEKLKGYYKTLNEEEKVAFATTMYEHFSNNLATTKTGAAQLVLDVISGDETTTTDKAFSIVEKAAIPLSLAFGAGQLLRGARSIAGAAKMSQIEKQLAEVGAKDTIIAGAAQRMASKGAMQIAGAVTGVTDMVDAAKLVTLASSKVMPEAVTTAVSGLQDLIKARTDDLVKNLRETIAAKNIRSSDAADELAALQSKYSRAYNKEVHSFHPQSADGTGATLYLKPADETAYLTMEAAEAAVKAKDPRGVLGLRVVPDTTNTGYLVNDEVFKARLLERDALEAEYIKTNATQQRIQARVAKMEPPPAEPASLLSSKPTYFYKANKFDLQWDSTLDKAIYQLGSKTAKSSSDLEVFEWVKASLGIKDDAKAFATITKNASAIRSYLRQTAKNLSGGTLQIPKQVDVPAAKTQDAGVVASKKLDKLRSDIDFLDQQISAMKSAKTGLVQGYLIEQKVAPSGLYKDLAPYTQQDVSSMVRFSFGDWSLGTSDELYSNRLVGTLQSSRYQKLLTEFIRPSVEKLNKREKIVLNDSLVKGDKEGEEFTAAQLLSMGATDNVVKAYMEIRTLRNTMFVLRNNAAAKSLTGNGYMSLKMPPILDEPGQVFGRQITKEAAKNKKIYNVSTGAATEVDEKIARGNYLIYELWKPVTIGGKQHRNIAISPNAVVEQAIQTVIPYRKGEFKRVYTDQYFVKYRTTSVVDGVVEPERLLAHRTAASKADAVKYANAFNKAADEFARGELTLEKAAAMQPFGWKPEDFIAALDRNEFGVSPKMEVKFNRTEDDYLNDLMSTGGSQFSQERGQHIKSVYGEDTPNTLSPLDSIAAEIGNTAFMVPITEWRDVAIHRWYNTAKDVLPAEAASMTPENAFYYMVNTKGKYLGEDSKALFAQRVQDYALNEVSVATKEEQVWQGNMRLLSERLEGEGGNKAMALTGAALRNADLVGFARAVSFHGFLGGFNPVQLLVQGLNAANAVVISPVHGLKASREAAAMRIALMSDREEVWRGVASLDKLSSLGLASADEFVETVKAIRRSGLLDGINSTSLYGAETGKYSLFSKTRRTAGETSAFFFNRGEEMSRIISFSVARREFQAANPGVDWTTDASLNKILRRQDNLTQNMTSANRASFQQGILSIPAQFLQYNINLALNLAYSLAGSKRAFSRKEAISLLVGHGLLWGTAGMGSGTLWDAEEVLGEALNELAPEEKLYVQQGVAAGVINTASIALSDEPLELALGARFGTFQSYTGFVDALFGSEAQDVRDLAFGASGGAMLRFGKNFADASKLFWYNKEDFTEETVIEGMKLLGTGSFSSLNNIHKSYLAKNAGNMVMSRTGDPLYAVTDGQRIAMAIGLPPASAYDYEQLVSHNKHLQDMYVKVAKDIGRYQVLALTALEDGDMVAYEQHKNVIYALRAGLTPADKLKVDKEYHKMWVNSKHRELLINRLKKGEERSPLLVNEGNVR